MICLAGGGSGVLLSLAATKWLASAWQDLPSAEVIRVDGVVLGFACALVFLAALLAALLPAISSTGKAALAALQASSRTTSGNVSRAALRKTLLTVEIAVTVVLLIGAGLLLKSFVRLRGADVGCVTNNVLTLDLNLPAQKYGSPQKVNAFNETLLEKLRAMPGIRAVALGSNLPGEGYGGDDDFTIKEHPPLKPGEGIPDALARWADPGYFSALQIPLLSGRFFTSDDRLDRARKVLVSSLFARQYFPGKIRLAGPFTYSIKTAPITKLSASSEIRLGRSVNRSGQSCIFRSSEAALKAVSRLQFALIPIRWRCPFRCKSRLRRSIPNCLFPMCRPCSRRLGIRWAMLASAPPW